MSDLLKLVGANIRRLRKGRRFTLEALAERSNLHHNYLGEVERGEKNISATNLEGIAAALRVKPYELMLPTGTANVSEELIALITMSDPVTQNLLVEVLKRIPEWKKKMLAARRKGSGHRES